MNIKRKLILGTVLTMAVLASPLAAQAQITVNVAPLYYSAPAPERTYTGFRTYNDTFYHYEADRNGWYYGRNHEEYVQEEQRRAKPAKTHHDNGKHKGWYK